MSNIFYQDKPIIGVDINQTSIKFMSIDPRHWRVMGYGSVDLDPTEVAKSLETDGKYLGQSVRKLLKEKIVGDVASNHAVLSIPTAKTYARTFTIPAKNVHRIKEAISLEVEQYIPVPINLLYVDHQIIESDKDNITVQLCAVPKSVVDNCTSAVRSAGLEVIMVEPGINSIARLLMQIENGDLTTVIVDVSSAATDIAILDGSIRVSGSTSIGGNTFTLSIAKQLHLPLESAHQLKIQYGLNVSPRQAKISAALEPILKQIVSEIRKVIRYYSERLGSEKKIEQVIVVGGGSNMPGLGEYLTNALLLPARVASPWQILNFGQLEEPPKQFKTRYITVAGLSIVRPTEVFNDQSA